MRTAFALATALALAGIAAAAQEVDDMEGDAAAWEGPVAVDGAVAHSGKQSLRWELAAGETIALGRAMPQAAGANMLSLWVHSQRMTAAKVELSLLAPDAENRFSIRFSVEWTGWNHLQLEKDVFREEGSPSWDQVAGLQLTGAEGPCPPTVLHLDDIEWRDDSPAWEMEHGELLIAPLYSSLFSRLSRWAPDEPTEQLPAGAARLTRRWNSLIVERGRDPGQPSEVAFGRQLNLDLGGIRALRIQAALPDDATLAMSAQIDGKPTEILPPTPGRNNWHEYVAPVSGERLEALYLRCGDYAPALRPNSLRRVEYHFHFITVETDNFDPPQYPADSTAIALPKRTRASEPLLEAGLTAWLYFGREDIPALRDKVKEGLAAEMFEKLRAKADGYLGYDPTPFAGPYYPTRSHEWLRPWYVSQPWADMAQTCAFVYVLTDDLRYAEQAKRALLAMASLDKWNYGMISKYPVGWGGHGGPFCEASSGAPAALAYNWVYNTLTDDERRQIEEAMLWKSWFWLNDYIDTRDYIRAMNQGPWFNFGALIQAMALARRYPWLKDFYPKYEANIRESIELCYFRDGANTEGAAYWGATTRYVARALPLLAHEFGTPLAEYVPEPLQKSIEMPIYMRSMVTDEFRVLGVNDGAYGSWNPADTGLFFAALLDQPVAQWAWQETAGRTGSYGDLMQSLIWYRDWGEAPRPELSVAKQFRGVGWIALRSGWEVGDILFCLQCGIWGRGHQHLDKNSFVLEAYGERLCPDKGVPAYGDARGPFFQKTVSHNAITINGGDQRRADPKVLRFEHSEAYDIIDSDATANYSGARKVVRRVLFMRPEYFVIADEVVTARPSSIELNLHTFSDITVEEDTVRFRGSEADMLIKVVSPAIFTHSFAETQRSPNEPVMHDIQLAPPRPVTEANYITVLFPLRKGQPEPEIAYERTSAGATIRVRSESRDDVIEWTDGEGLAVKGQE